MSVHNTPSPYGSSGAHQPDTPFAEYAQSPSQRIAGWSAEKQVAFLQGIAEGLTVGQACRVVGLSMQSAYAFRQSARGTQFSIGWQAALLKSRDMLADTLMERALHGNVETVTRPDGSETERHRFDNRLAMAMLTRLDRLADKGAKETTHAAARLAAEDFAEYLELIAADAGPARAGLFLARRIAPAGAYGLAPAGAYELAPAGEDDLAPIRTLARADAWLRTHTDLAEPLADLDPAARTAWSGADWLRAETAGLVAIAPPPAPAQETQANQHFPEAEAPEDDPVWWDHVAEGWRTSFPPTEDFDGEEDGAFGEDGYARTLTVEEEALVEAPYEAELAARRLAEGAARDRWFALLAPAGADPAGAAPPLGYSDAGAIGGEGASA
jgi:hypothetical protein